MEIDDLHDISPAGEENIFMLNKIFKNIGK